jgi:hypothetical protein
VFKIILPLRTTIKNPYPSGSLFRKPYTFPKPDKNSAFPPVVFSENPTEKDQFKREEYIVK